MNSPDSDEIVIIRRGKPAATLIQPADESNEDVATIVQRMLDERDRSGRRVAADSSIRALRDEGRRY